MLTEHERRVLQQIAHDLARDDPRLARSLSRPRDHAGPAPAAASPSWPSPWPWCAPSPPTLALTG
jgi:hypothetical protein